MPPPVEGLTPELAAQFDELQRKFAAGLPQRLHDITAAPDPQAMQAALHRLAGAAGAYGYADLGTVARQAMEASSGRNAADLAPCLARLAAEVQRVSAGAGAAPGL